MFKYCLFSVLAFGLMQSPSFAKAWKRCPVSDQDLGGYPSMELKIAKRINAGLLLDKEATPWLTCETGGIGDGGSDVEFEQGVAHTPVTYLRLTFYPSVKPADQYNGSVTTVANFSILSRGELTQLPVVCNYTFHATATHPTLTLNHMWRTDHHGNNRTSSKFLKECPAAPSPRETNLLVSMITVGELMFQSESDAAKELAKRSNVDDLFSQKIAGAFATIRGLCMEGPALPTLQPIKIK